MARSFPTRTSRDSPDIHGRSAPWALFVRETVSRSSCRATESCRRTASAPTDRSAWSTRSGCWPSNVSFSEDLRHELAAIAPRNECDRLAELSGLFHSAGSVHLKGRGEVSVHVDVADSAVARRAFSLLRGFGVASEIRTYRRRAFDSATRYQLHVAGNEHALQVLHEAGVLSSRLTPLAHRSTLAAPRDPNCRAGRRGLPGPHGGRGGSPPRRPRSDPACRRVCKGNGDDRRRPRARRRRQGGARLRGEFGDGGDALPSKSARECRSCEPRSHESRGARATARGPASSAYRRAGKAAHATPRDRGIA